MTQTPILFSTPMVQAILAGNKTMTRRVIKPQPILNGNFWELYGAAWSDNIKHLSPVYGHSLYNNADYKIGDVLWVREKYYVVEREGKGIGNQFIIFEDEWENGMPKTNAPYRPTANRKWGCHPSIHMPKDACRLLLEITNVHVERLQDISEADARAEGIRSWTKDGSLYKFGVIEPGDAGAEKWIDMPRNAKYAFADLWCKINGAESWDANPWVWVVSFKRIDKPL